MWEAVEVPKLDIWLSACAITCICSHVSSGTTLDSKVPKVIMKLCHEEFQSLRSQMMSDALESHERTQDNEWLWYRESRRGECFTHEGWKGLGR